MESSRLEGLKDLKAAYGAAFLAIGVLVAAGFWALTEGFIEDYIWFDDFPLWLNFYANFANCTGVSLLSILMALVGVFLKFCKDVDHLERAIEREKRQG